MQQSRIFGRRVSLSAASPPRATKPRAPPSVETLQIATDSAPVLRSEDEDVLLPARDPPSLEQELEEWKAARKRRKRSFREPWRTVSIVAGLGLAATSWMVPGSVATVAELALGVLSTGSFLAGWRGRTPPASVGAGTVGHTAEPQLT
jgi:hypothetical protein